MRFPDLQAEQPQTTKSFGVKLGFPLGAGRVGLQGAKAELLREGIIFLIHLFVRAILLMKKLKIEETKATQYSTFETDIIKVGLVFSISNFFITKIALANIWMSFSCSNLALVEKN